jgi:hypothetical protein
VRDEVRWLVTEDGFAENMERTLRQVHSAVSNLVKSEHSNASAAMSAAIFTSDGPTGAEQHLMSMVGFHLPIYQL